MSTPIIETIVLPAETLANLPASMLVNIQAGFSDAFAKAEELRQRALAIVVKDHTDFATMKEARAVRLELKDIRVSAEKSRKAMKEDSLRMGRAIDGVYNLLEAAVVPLEQYLSEQENAAALHAEREKARILAERVEAITPYMRPGVPLPDLASLDADQWTDYLADAKLLHEARVEQERKAEAERIAAEQAAKAEQEKLRLENERLRAEKEAAEAERKEAEAKAAAAHRAKQAAAKKLLDEANAELAKEKAAREKVEAEAKAKAEAERKAAEAQAKAEAAAKRKAARAPDKAKLEAMIAAYRAVEVPKVTSTEMSDLLDACMMQMRMSLRSLEIAIAE